MINHTDILSAIKSLHWRGGGIPHPCYNIERFKDSVLALATGKKQPKALVDLSAYAKQIDLLVVIALDSINYDLFSKWAAELDLDGLIPLTSVFPSTSSTAWTTIHTGLPPAEHGIYGVTFYSPEFGSVYSTYHRLRDMQSRYHAIPDVTSFKLFDRNPHTLMQELDTEGWRCVVLRGEPISRQSPSCMLKGWSAKVQYVAPLDARNNPDYLAKCLIRQGSQVISKHFQKKGRKLFLWLLADFDAYIHNTLDFMPGLESAWNRLGAWIGDVYSHTHRTGFVFIADHGQVPQEPDLSLFEKLESVVQDPELCYAHRAGAGRAVYVYPHPTRLQQVKQTLEDAFGGNAVVVTRDQAKTLGLFGSHRLALEERVGNLVVIGQTPKFPAHSLQAFHEHGSLSWQELVVPFAWKLPR